MGLDGNLLNDALEASGLNRAVRRTRDVFVRLYNDAFDRQQRLAQRQQSQLENQNVVYAHVDDFLPQALHKTRVLADDSTAVTAFPDKLFLETPFPLIGTRQWYGGSSTDNLGEKDGYQLPDHITSASPRATFF